MFGPGRRSVWTHHPPVVYMLSYLGATSVPHPDASHLFDA